MGEPLNPKVCIIQQELIGQRGMYVLLWGGLVSLKESLGGFYGSKTFHTINRSHIFLSCLQNNSESNTDRKSARLQSGLHKVSQTDPTRTDSTLHFFLDGFIRDEGRREKVK